MIYLDYNATTPVDPEVLEAMLPCFTEDYGNPSSAMHSLGWRAEGLVVKAREQVSKVFNCSKEEITFTSGSTESLNMALLGLWEQFSKYKNHIITSAAEHSAVYETCKYLESKGAKVTYLDIDQDGLIDLNELESSITVQTFLVSIMLVNNETGVIQDMKSVSAVCKEKGILIMSDTTQAIGKIPVDVQDLGIDIATVSAHKIYGPKGVGAIYTRRRSPRVNIPTLFHGGGQESGKRSGTLNVPGIVGLGKACELIELRIKNQELRINNDSPSAILSEAERSRSMVQGKFLKERLEQELIKLGGVINGHPEQRVWNTINVSFEENAHDLIKRIQTKIAVSLGSACSSGSGKPSRVLTSMGLSDKRIKGSIRLSLGIGKTEEDIDKVINVFSSFVDCRL